MFDSGLAAAETRPLLCNAWLEQEEFSAATLDQVSAGQTHHSWTSGFQSDSEDETDTAERAPRRASKFVDAAPSDGITADGRFCFLCSVQGVAKSDYRDQMNAFIQNNLGQMDNSTLCMSVARFYAWKALTHTKQPWGAADVWEHITVKFRFVREWAGRRGRRRMGRGLSVEAWSGAQRDMAVGLMQRVFVRARGFDTAAHGQSSRALGGRTAKAQRVRRNTLPVRPRLRFGREADCATTRASTSSHASPARADLARGSVRRHTRQQTFEKLNTTAQVSVLRPCRRSSTV
jgi:hypothetical protein